MTLEQIENTLPNGLHDAQIASLYIDYKRACLTFEVEVLVGLPGQPHPECESYRRGRLSFEPMYYCSIEYPQPGVPFEQPGLVWFSYERTARAEIPASVEQHLPKDTQYYSLFIREWLSSIHVASGAVGFSWQD